MRSRLILNLLLVTLVAGLILVVIYRPGLDQVAETQHLSPLSAEHVERIRIERADGDIVMVREASGWRMVEPLAGRVSGYRAEGLASLAQAPVSGSLDATGADLAQFGLETPTAMIWLNDLRLTLGGTNPVSRQRYVLYNGRIGLIPDNQLAQISADAAGLLDTRLFGDGVELLAVRLPGLALSRRDGHWSADPPLDELDPDSITRFVNEWRQARALRVSRADAAPVQETITVELLTAPAGPRSELEIGVVQRSPQLLLRRLDENLDYRFTEASGQKLLDPAPR